ncbi:hypothetical protein I41_05150 [Lacipirellula limnantheis]|uniref:Uncharacterized protein n=1 Tax=Lacipirellula limnantheis TaxID=2528024 RepID=A0A517TSK9_9BACT|nr:hypothetical protein I41_05150 [Lacipirellula limnantheis]
MVRFLASLVASAIAAQVAFYDILSFIRAYPFLHGAIIGAALFGLIRLGEIAVKRRLPAWTVVPAVAIITGYVYWHFMVGMVGV